MNLENDLILPVQYYGNAPKALSGERKLLLTVVQEAILTLLKPPGKGRLAHHAVEEARTWLAADDLFPFSFRWCCEHLQLDPLWVRRQIRHYQEHGGLPLPYHIMPRPDSSPTQTWGDG